MKERVLETTLTAAGPNLAPILYVVAASYGNPKKTQSARKLKS